ncbi:hypothetical protein Nepgr_009096 [Nepenthes gracilis]|uniref:PGG domain-containing protein n=1 Tax=Nepenthes gracilis TaxID=150966 RepID=A0AAD3SAC7_NEPGR|nr:hypothetical protein Nepgr_009096 [Nepenthes gracilis]
MMTLGQAAKYKSSMDTFAQIIKNKSAKSLYMLLPLRVCLLAPDRFLSKLEDGFLRKLNEFLREQKEWHEQQKRNGRLESHRNAIMIAASLIAAASFHAGANTTGGFWQGDSNSNHTAGESILADCFPREYGIMTASNATAFFTSADVFLLLLSGLPLNNKFCAGILMVAMWIAIVAAGFSFLITTKAIGFDTDTFNKISPWVKNTAGNVDDVVRELLDANKKSEDI